MSLKRSYPKNKWWAVESDYYHTLSPENQEYLNKFADEFHNGSVKKGDANALHSSDEMRRDCYARNNGYNRDLFSILDCVGRMYHGNKTKDDLGALIQERLSVLNPKFIEPELSCRHPYYAYLSIFIMNRVL